MVSNSELDYSKDQFNYYVLLCHRREIAANHSKKPGMLTLLECVKNSVETIK